MTQEEVAKAMGITKSQVATIEKQAIAKVKAILEERGINIKDLLGD